MGFVSTETYGIKGYNGVCIASKHPIKSVNKQIFCKKDDARHINIELVYKKKKLSFIISMFPQVEMSLIQK